MRILMVEDDELKARKVEEFLYTYSTDLTLLRAMSVNSAVKALTTTQVDLVVLDMTLPAFDIRFDEDGGTRKPFGGREILRQMEALDLTIPTVVVTQFQTFGEGERALSLIQLDAQIRTQYENYLGAVQYRSDLDTWKDILASIIARVELR